MAGILNLNSLDFQENLIGYADTKYYGGLESSTILIPSVQQFQGVVRINATGAFEQK
jgi:hypothetical protein